VLADLAVLAALLLGPPALPLLVPTPPWCRAPQRRSSGRHRAQLLARVGAESPREKGYLATMQAQTPEDGRSTLIITRRGIGRAARTWLTLDGGIRCTAALDRAQVEELRELLAAAAEGLR